MATKNTMRVTKADIKEYNRLKRNVTRKINTTKEQHNIDISSDINIKPIEEYSRQEFNAFKEQARLMTSRVPRYQYRKLNDHVSVTVAEYDKLKYYERVAKRKADERFNKIKDKGYYVDGQQRQKVGEYASMMRDPDIPGISPPHLMDEADITSREYVQRKITQFEKMANQKKYDEAARTMKENYLQKLKEVFGNNSSEVYEKIEQLNSDDFVTLYSMTDEVDFKYLYYDMENDEQNELLSNIDSYVDKYQNGEMDLSFERAKNNIQ